MAATAFQQQLCRLIATSRRGSGESYVAGGVALNTLLQAPRISRDIDLFHDTDEALRVSWESDRTLLTQEEYGVHIIRQTPAYVEAVVSKEEERVIVQWLRESAFRFFPLLEDERFGLVLHPFDLATNKILALAGRLESRDWIDVLTTHEKLQPLGYLAWAACGKDPGFSPASLLAEASSSASANGTCRSLPPASNLATPVAPAILANWMAYWLTAPAPPAMSRVMPLPA